MGSGTTSYGCGLLISWHQKRYILTAGHVIRVAQMQQIWAMPDLKLTQDPRGGYEVIWVEEVFVDDNYDLAVCEIMEPPNIFKHSFFPLETHSENVPAGLNPGDKVELAGYPVEYVEEQVKANREDPLPLCRIEGEITAKPIPKDIEKRGFPSDINNSIINNSILVQLKKGVLMKGFSGGTVLKNDIPSGIAIGGITYEVEESEEVAVIDLRAIKQFIKIIYERDE